MNNQRPPYSPDIGERFFAVGSRQVSGRRFYTPMRVEKVTPKQIVAIDPLGRSARFWRDKWCELGNWQFALRIEITIPDGSMLSGSLKQVCDENGDLLT